MSQQNLYKGNLRIIILKLLTDKEKMYGYEITQKVKELTKGKLNITEGALYPALHKLEAEGMLEVEVVKVDNRLRKYYKITGEGSKEIKLGLNELEEFIKTLQNIIDPKPGLI